MKPASLFALLGSYLCASPGHTAPAKPSAKIQFNRDVRPILSETCFTCHGPDKSHRKAGLRLDLREEALKSGAIVPGKPEASEAIKRIFTTNPDELMPPTDSHKTLTAKQKQTLKQWVAEGAEYQPHWAFIAPTKAPLPP